MKITADQMLQVLNRDGFYYRTEYHNFNQISDILKECLEDYNKGDIVDDDNDINDNFREFIQEYCDSSTPIYYAQRAEWFGENWGAVNEYIENIGTERITDIMDIIGAAYCYSLENGVMELFDHIISEVKENN